MYRCFALLGLAALCGCGNSNNRVVTHGSSPELGVSQPYTLVSWKSR